MGKTDKAGAVLLFVVVILALVFGIMRNDGEGGDPGNENEVAKSADKKARKADLSKLRHKFDENKPGSGVAKRPPDRVPNRKKPGAKSGADGDRAPGKTPQGAPKVSPEGDPGKKPDAGKAVAGDWPKKHEIAGGDVLGAICARYYGTTRMVDRVLDANPGLDPKHLRIGKKIVLPAPPADLAARGTRATGERPAAALRRPSFISSEYLRRNAGGAAGTVPRRDLPSGARTYTVRTGDVLSKIAQHELGSSRYVDRLIEANKDLIKDPDKLREGWVLVLPKVD